MSGQQSSKPKCLHHHCRFWRGVEAGLVAELNQAWSYKYDLEMLGYSHALYFQGLGLETMG